MDILLKLTVYGVEDTQVVTLSASLSPYDSNQCPEKGKITHEQWEVQSKFPETVSTQVIAGPGKHAGFTSQVNPKAPEVYFLDRNGILFSTSLTLILSGWKKDDLEV